MKREIKVNYEREKENKNERNWRRQWVNERVLSREGANKTKREMRKRLGPLNVTEKESKANGTLLAISKLCFSIL